MASINPVLPNFCADCGNSKMILKVPDGDERMRACCDECGRIEYSNPKIVVSCVVRAISSSSSSSSSSQVEETQNGKILVAKRAIEPRKGTWGIPQGYMEHGETTRQAAVREVYEETGAIVDPSTLKFRAIYNVPGSVQLLYEAIVDAAKTQQEIHSYHDNHESLEVILLDEAALAEKEICFPTVQWALDHCLSLRKHGATNCIQQMTKIYNAEKDKWEHYEDEPLGR